jgi:hypothetical protein
MRVIWNTLHPRPLTETFHEFILYLLRTQYGQEWKDEQDKLPKEKQHILLRWQESYKGWREAHQVTATKEGDRYGGEPSGDVLAFHLFAYDFYCLQVVNKLPDDMIKRLRRADLFQGARYEIAVAAIIARAGFDLEWLTDPGQCEFIATHKRTGLKFGVEAKSRPRPGVLNQPGEFEEEAETQKGVQNVFRKALSQRPKDLPFLIFIDLNLPSSPEIPFDKKKWFPQILEMLDARGPRSEEKTDIFNALVLTNFSFYYGGNIGPAPKGEFVVTVSRFPQVKLSNMAPINDIMGSLDRYPRIPMEV